MIQCENRKCFTWGLTGKIMCIFWALNIKMSFGMVHLFPAHQIYINAGVFIDDKSSNRMELSQYIQDGAEDGCAYMLRNCKWRQPQKHPGSSCLTCVCVSMCMCTHAWGFPHPFIHLFSNEWIKIIQFSLKILNLWRLPHPWIGIWLGG